MPKKSIARSQEDNTRSKVAHSSSKVALSLWTALCLEFTERASRRPGEPPEALYYRKFDWSLHEKRPSDRQNATSIVSCDVSRYRT